MSPKKYYSNKKTSQLTISTSPALKDWIQRYVNVQHELHPEDKKLKSVSAFYHEVMETVMDLFEKGLTLEDLEKVVDSTVDGFYEQFTFRATIPFYEIMVESNRYSASYLEKSRRFLFELSKFYTTNLEPYDSKSVRLWLDRLEKYANNSKIAKFFSFEVKEKDKSGHEAFFLEYIGTNENLHFENCKMNAAIIGILGCKVTDLIYYPRDLYCRLDFIATDLFYESQSLRKERLHLMNENLQYLINYSRLIQDEDYYLWLKMANDKDITINFNTKKARKKWTSLLEEHFEKFGQKEEFLSNVLNFFERLHWIDIENREDLSFRMRLSREKNNDEIQFLTEYISNHSAITIEDGIYYLE